GLGSDRDRFLTAPSGSARVDEDRRPDSARVAERVVEADEAVPETASADENREEKIMNASIARGRFAERSRSGHTSDHTTLLHGVSPWKDADLWDSPFARRSLWDPRCCSSSVSGHSPGGRVTRARF